MNPIHMSSSAISDETAALKGILLNELSFGFDEWLEKKTSADLFACLTDLSNRPLGRAQANQILHLSHEPGVSEGFFRYYFLSIPLKHPYDVTKVPGFENKFIGGSLVTSIHHLKWGLYRFYVDALLYFGDGRIAFTSLRALSFSDLADLFSSKRFDTESMELRGPALPLSKIAKDNRYLISEMACKSYGGDLRRLLVDTYKNRGGVGGKIRIRELLEKALHGKTDRQAEFLFSADSILDEEVETAEQLEEKYEGVFKAFEDARRSALKNTNYFLSMVNDLDVYVATSMRNRADFRKMADFCENVFGDPSLKKFGLRYFDPTVSAAVGHEDKGLIECLMVKSAKVLIYCAGEKDSFGKDAEAAMALSLGKPVIFYCDETARGRFFSEIHPLSRLIEFRTGVAMGAMVTSKQEHVVSLLDRIFSNQMVYSLKRKPAGLRLIEDLTGSTVRLQTSDEMLRETFWNYYHKQV
jgi:hypothetical protein